MKLPEEFGEPAPSALKILRDMKEREKGEAERPKPPSLSEMKQASMEKSPAHLLFTRGYNYLNRSTEVEDLEEALKNFEEAVKIDPNHVFLLFFFCPHSAQKEAHIYLGNCLGALGRHEEALKSYLASLERHPEDASLLLNAGTELAYLKRHDESIAYLERAIKHTFDSLILSEAHFNLGTSYYVMRDLEKAREHLSKTLSLNYKHVEALSNMGNICIENEEYNEAEAFFKRSLKYDPSQLIPRLNLGIIYTQTNRDTLAREIYTQVKEIDPDEEEAQALLKTLSEFFETKEEEEEEEKTKPATSK